ncbi:MAG: XTP/dITP diphosphatase [Beduini sp.]|uniref:XTP/dITP diphosphatase n=1 Tax=Beduini sp. TaxID=1922300 RepID=UPI0039A3482A
MKELIIATTNNGKMKEMRTLLAPLNIEVKSILDEFNENIEIEENGKTFKENALIKAQAIADRTGKVTLADDSGLVIDALEGRPGVESARFLGHDTSYTIKNNHILELMKNKQDRSARFVCAIAIVIPNQKPILFEETFEGEIAKEILGENGFGYDPIFYFPPLDKTSAEMSMEEKNQYSHRAKAVKKAIEIIKKL